ncbi:hypothetical protein SODALDRAFT_354852 [Sodiomyces alkalinus F11]|uniref:Uncharacterized protein n=1 Tax=Sodiomyces alkalinus (strain CBS 110278 / VKM F-3762 / F11) TaxID=1314773 RepID=A0A3N2Q7S7_SODAK|nr:hypothetical protein SODALDRAFT_354852 [Sodiomyces alkalinus F11]ROT42685.1 hypothetical protein SODALDRAFT_354852 [Sodiomyces alkalinus F11]
MRHSLGCKIPYPKAPAGLSYAAPRFDIGNSICDSMGNMFSKSTIEPMLQSLWKLAASSYGLSKSGSSPVLTIPQLLSTGHNDITAGSHAVSHSSCRAPLPKRPVRSIPTAALWSSRLLPFLSTPDMPWPAIYETSMFTFRKLHHMAYIYLSGTLLMLRNTSLTKHPPYQGHEMTRDRELTDRCFEMATRTKPAVGIRFEAQGGFVTSGPQPRRWSQWLPSHAHVLLTTYAIDDRHNYLRLIDITGPGFGTLGTAL